MSDDEFLDRLQEITGQDADVWTDFNPSKWRTLPQFDGASDLDYDLGKDDFYDDADEEDDGNYGSEYDEAPGLLNIHKLTRTERIISKRAAAAAGGGGDGDTSGPSGKLNKAREYAAGEVAFPNAVAKLENQVWKDTGLELGERSDESDRFVPWKLIIHYPDLFVGKANGVRAAPLFTLDALHENRVWDLYYIHAPPDMKLKPVIFAPTHQFRHLLDVVNAKLDTQLTIPGGKNAERFEMEFGADGGPVPRFLGRSESAQTFNALSEAVPEAHPDDDVTKITTQFGVDEFRFLLKQTRVEEKKIKKADKNRAKRLTAHKDWARSIKRVQRYLGLRSREVEGQVEPVDVDLLKHVAHEPEGSVLFVAIDIEAWEKDHNMITEVGIAILDTLVVRPIPPGENGVNWLPLIEARHIRVQENSWALNSRYVHGCPDRFNFGTSEFVKLDDISQLIKNIIDDATLVDPATGTAQPRPVVLVFHEATSDLKYLQCVSYHAGDADNVIDVADTRVMYQSLVRKNDASSLVAALDYLELPHKNLHNAGNDAVYTLQAMVGLAVKKMGVRAERKKERADGYIPYSEFKAKEGWTSGDESDGGAPAGLPAGWSAEGADN
ncbi:hypothetical protein B0J18DRAFT_197574 [Chaetomium sp. MPI-SDFR-AT-0129]|nr:hypothetical protein B0J18DRAFT_197574 [Chaetomium sp. MPI-SDFR-AT-0129]